MKVSNSERKIIESRRKFIKTLANSSKIVKYRKASIPSKGEQKVIEYLNSERIRFTREWFFKGLYNKATNQLLYFDFYLNDYNCCIEFDGQQHYSSDKTENQKVNDFLKGAYCAKNSIPFLRIKYTDIDNVAMVICRFFDKISPIT